MTESAKILIVEDSPTQAMILKSLLSRNGYGVVLAKDGRKGLLAAQEWKPDLVISDVMMPVMNGFELCKAIKGKVALRDIPVILLTSLSKPENIIQGINVHADYYVTKPYEHDFLLSKVEDILAHQSNQEKEKGGNGLQISLAGKSFTIRANRQQIVNILLSTYENALLQNRELIDTRDKLEKSMEELTKSQTQLIQAEKKSALATLVAGVAHELNNPMMGMLNYVQYCLKHLPDNPKLQTVLKDTERETYRCIEIVRNLLTFSRVEKAGEEEYRKVSCLAIFERVVKLLSYRIGKENVTVTRRIDDRVPEIRLRANSIQQVFLNLIVNALDALKESDKKELELRIRPGNRFVQVSIADSGCGISPENLPRIFDPFFTTKPVGEGTGLGLSLCHGIIKDHGGEMTCESKPGSGTAFTLMLPMEQK